MTCDRVSTNRSAYGDLHFAKRKAGQYGVTCNGKTYNRLGHRDLHKTPCIGPFTVSYPLLGCADAFFTPDNFIADALL